MRPPVNRGVAGVVLLDRLQVQAAVLPAAPGLRAAVVLRFQDHRHAGPEGLGPGGMEVGPLAGLDEDAVVAERQAVLCRVPHHLACPRGVVAAQVVVGRQQRLVEVLLVQVDVPLDGLGLDGPPGARSRVPLAPDAQRADVDEGDLGVAVIPGSHRRQEVVELVEEDRIVEVRLPERPVRLDAFAGTEVVALGAGVGDPLGRGPAGPRFACRDAEGHLLALGDPPLGRRVEDRPAELPLLRLDVRPGDAEVDHRQSRPIVERVGGGELRAVVRRHVVVVVEDPAHARVGQGRTVVGRADSHHFLPCPGSRGKAEYARDKTNPQVLHEDVLSTGRPVPPLLSRFRGPRATRPACPTRRIASRAARGRPASSP